MLASDSTPAPASPVPTVALWPLSLPLRIPLDDVRNQRIDELFARFERDVRQVSMDQRGEENVERRLILHGAWVAVHELRCRLRGVAW